MIHFSVFTSVAPRSFLRQPSLPRFLGSCRRPASAVARGCTHVQKKKSATRYAKSVHDCIQSSCVQLEVQLEWAGVDTASGEAWSVGWVPLSFCTPDVVKEARALNPLISPHPPSLRRHLSRFLESNKARDRFTQSRGTGSCVTWLPPLIEADPRIRRSRDPP